MNKVICLLLIIILPFGFLKAQDTVDQGTYHEKHRLQVHFSPKAHWMNDPNGMVYYEGVYHLFFQYYPGGTTWGPMHWGHATSTDLVHWQEQPIALYPDSLGYIFSGSAVWDKHNTSGFGLNGKGPLVAVFTHHNPNAEVERKNDWQYQSLAYSNDSGKTWIKYAGNPVLRKPNSTDFRDPKITWYEDGRKWIMTLAVKDHIEMYSSPDLKSWVYESEFGRDLGAHGGVWECPDLFPLEFEGKTIWVMIINLNPGAPNGGSGVQYFLGTFNGKAFVPLHKETRWLDYGPDNYAGVTWDNTGKRRVLIGWMSNWNYANVVPTVGWRSAMTLPRTLGLIRVGKDIYLTNNPVKEIKSIESRSVTINRITTNMALDMLPSLEKLSIPCKLEVELSRKDDFSFTFSNDQGEELLVGYERETKRYFIDRTRAGDNSFHSGFAKRFFAPDIAGDGATKLVLVMDKSSVELWSDNGLTALTAVYFPNAAYNHLTWRSRKSIARKISITDLNSIWERRDSR
ncbi:glycoside hydrolase family 32 protein [Flavihumibacter rivuli]|uniref:glycoside hydrolase family 32 protein n=1 Tax=Flavihumibacter rivuli TaxID=2838156 RepID=UPI001BDF0055|nr:glycoside hydrolase family 32 protein [Flavihumibacter rivuli]ULQ58100.1 glycoside hydrolase family 32 protein [Flavihumibacter rivuli]